MIIFLFLFTAYGLGHLYLFLKLKSTFQIESVATTLLVIFLLVMMTLSPFFVHLYSFRGPANRARILAYPGYMWLSLLLVFCAVALSIDLYNYAVQFSVTVLRKGYIDLALSPMTSFSVPAILSVILNIYGVFEAGDLRVETLTVHTDKLPEGTDKLTVAHLSDLHLGLILAEKRLEKVLKCVESARPDLIVSTGDLLDDEVHDIGHLSERLQRVEAPLGKYAVTGNHEVYAGVERADEFLEDSGFTVLHGEGVTVQDMINIAGVDDPTIKDGGSPNPHSLRPEHEILDSLPRDLFTVLLKHRPSIDKRSLGSFDLQLSGHAHKGQFLPVRFFTKLFYHTDAGYSPLPEGSAIFVSPGAGTAGPPVRLFAPPEVTIIEVVSGKQVRQSRPNPALK